MNIHQKLVEVRKSIKGFSKDTAGYGYSYVSGSQILKAIKSKMDELGVLLVPEVDYDTLHWEKHEYKNKKGEEKLDFLITMKMNYTWINAEDPNEKITVPWVCIGQQTDDISKAVGTAMTYNERYFLLKFLGLPTDEDDADGKEPQETTKSYGNKSSNSNSKSSLSEAQINRLYAIANEAGINRVTVDKQVLKQMNKTVDKLNKSEYNLICDAYEKMTK